MQKVAIGFDSFCTFVNVYLRNENRVLWLYKAALRRIVLGVFVLVCGTPAAKADQIIDFEGLSDGTLVTTQYAGLTFSNAIILTSGSSLNEFEFPPHSGSNVVSDNGGPIAITFLAPIISFTGYFTYQVPLTIAAYDSSSHDVANASSTFSSNLALSGVSGSQPNEFLSVQFASGISKLILTGDPLGGSFVGDDFSTTTNAAPVPEPGTLILLCSASFLLLPRCFLRTLNERNK